MSSFYSQAPMVQTRTSTRPPPPTAATGKRILIVDNERGIGIALSFMLSARGYDDIRAVRSAPRAMSLAQRYLPHIVFLDVELPDEASLIIARDLRRLGRDAPRLIALTNDAEHPQREGMRAAGFERFLTKPVTNEELDKILKWPGNAAA